MAGVWPQSPQWFHSLQSMSCPGLGTATDCFGLDDDLVGQHGSLREGSYRFERFGWSVSMEMRDPAAHHRPTFVNGFIRSPFDTNSFLWLLVIDLLHLQLYHIVQHLFMHPDSIDLSSIHHFLVAGCPKSFANHHINFSLRLCSLGL